MYSQFRFAFGATAFFAGLVVPNAHAASSKDVCTIMQTSLRPNTKIR